MAACKLPLLRLLKVCLRRDWNNFGNGVAPSEYKFVFGRPTGSSLGAQSESGSPMTTIRLIHVVILMELPRLSAPLVLTCCFLVVIAEGSSSKSEFSFDDETPILMGSVKTSPTNSKSVVMQWSHHIGSHFASWCRFPELHHSLSQHRTCSMNCSRWSA